MISAKQGYKFFRNSLVFLVNYYFMKTKICDHFQFSLSFPNYLNLISCVSFLLFTIMKVFQAFFNEFEKRSSFFLHLTNLYFEQFFYNLFYPMFSESFTPY